MRDILCGGGALLMQVHPRRDPGDQGRMLAAVCPEFVPIHPKVFVSFAAKSSL
jgi:hypothetical protein